MRLSFLRVTLLALVPFMLVLGASFNVIIYPSLQVLSLALLGLTIGLWVVTRVRGGWSWHPTALDGVIWLWLGAIVIAALANPEHIRRGQPAFWYLAALMVGWYMLHDAQSNGILTRAHILDMLLLGGALSMVYAVRELFDPGAPSDGLLGLPRVGGLTGNPNLLSALLVPIIGAAFGRAWALFGVGRVVMGLYAVAAVALLVFTYSRGGWLGGGVAVGVLLLAFAIEQGWGTPAGLRAAWSRSRSWQKGAAVLFVLGALAGSVVVGAKLVDSLDDSGRSAELRTYLWLAAWDAFTEKPLTGHGLFSTPRLILDRSSVPPRAPQPHAHNFPLQVLAEMGIPGAIAMVASIAVALRAGVRAWRTAVTRRERHLIAGGWAGAIGFGVHNLFDLAAWTPYVSLAGLLVLLAMTAPPVPVPYPQRRARAGAGLAIAAACLVLLTGVYSASHFIELNDAIVQAYRPGQRLPAADRLDSLIAADPRQPVYRWNQGMLYAIAAFETQDPAMAQRARARFTEAGELGMDSAVLQLNLAGLSAQLGDTAAAAGHLIAAADYAPDSFTLLMNAALAAERWGIPDTAAELWERMTTLQGYETSELMLVPAAAESEFAAGLGIRPLEGEPVAVQRLASGDAAGAKDLLDEHPEWQTSRAHALRAIAAFHLGEDPEPHLAAGRELRIGIADYYWMSYAQAVIDGRPAPVFAAPANPLSLETLDEPGSEILARLHFMRHTFGRMIVPQVGYDGRQFAFAALEQ